MKLKITQNTLQNITKAGLFLCVIAIIAQLFPSENKFKYQFEVGKPWSYELITAAFDFPIYKNQQEVTAERDKLLKNYIPYFQIDTNTIDVQFKNSSAIIPALMAMLLYFRIISVENSTQSIRKELFRRKNITS